MKKYDSVADMSVDAIKREYYWLLSQWKMYCELGCHGIIVLDYDRDKTNKRIQELGNRLYDLTNGEEGFNKVT